MLPSPPAQRCTRGLRRFTKRRNRSTLRAAQSDNLSFKRQGMTRRSMPCLFHANLFALGVARWRCQNIDGYAVQEAAGRLVSRWSSALPAGSLDYQAPCRHSRVAAAPKNACTLDGFGCPTEAPYGCFLPDLTRFGTCRHPNPSNALGARYILPAPARQSKLANLGRSFFDYFCSPIARAANE